MADRRVKVLFEAQIGQYKAAMKEAASSTKDLDEKIKETGNSEEKAAAKRGKALKTLAPAVTAAGVATLAGVAIATKAFADFDKQMASVQAATHETADNMDLLREAAIRTGADTAFSAGEAAQGIEEMAKAGVSTADILAGGLDGSLALAAAGAIGVGDAAELAATALTQFKLEGSDVGHVADLLAAGAGKAQGSVGDLGAALKQSGLVAASTGLTIEETTGGLAAFASAGLVGSDAGTSFKSMLQRLTPQSEKASKLMDELGLSAYDANGNFVGLSEYAGILQEGLKDMTVEQRNATMATLFGSDAVRAANVLYEQGADGINKWEDAVNDAGYAAETAAIMQDNLAGDIEKLGGAFDTVFIKSGSGANDVLRGLVQGLEGVVDVIGQIPTPVLTVGTILAGVAGGAAVLAGGLVTVLPKIKDTREALRVLAPEGGRVDKAMRGLGKGARLAASGVAALAVVGPSVGALVSSGTTADAMELADALFKVGAGGNAASGGLNDLDAMFTSGGGFGSWFAGLDVNGIDEAFRVMGNPSVSDNIDNVLSKVLTLGTRGSSNIEFAKKNFAALDSQLVSMVSNGATEQAAASYEEMAKKAEAAGVPVEMLSQIFPQYNGALADASTKSQAAASGTDTLDTALAEVGVTTEGVVDDMETFLDQLFAAGIATRDQRGAMRDYEESIDAVADSIKENGKSLDITTEKGRANQAALDNIASSGQAVVEAMAANGASQEQLQGHLTGTYDSLIAAAGQFGIAGDKADALARKVLGVPDNVDVKTWMSDQAKKTAEATKTAVDNIPSQKNINVTITRNIREQLEPLHNPNQFFKNGGNKAGKVAPKGQGWGVLRRAAGGDLDMAPGPTGVDSMLFYGAKGEHVLTALDVAAMGGQDAVYRFRRNLHGAKGYASGGELGAARYAVPAASLAAQSVAASGGGTNIDLGGIRIYGATDVNAVRRAVLDEISHKFQTQGVRLG